MAIADVRLSVLGIINEVQEKLSVNRTTTVDETRLSLLLLRLLNETVAECVDYGDWQELFRETLVTASSSVEEYTITPETSALVQRVYEIHFGTQVSPLEVRTIEDIRRLQKTRGFGEPRQFAIIGVDASTGNPNFRPYPIPGSNENNDTFDIAYYIKPPLYTTNDNNTIPPLPANVLIQGVYAKAVLEESGQEPTNQYQVAYQEYIRMRKEALNRFTSDTGVDIMLQPTGANF